MRNDQLMLLIDRLAQKTEQDALSWSEGANQNSFLTSFPTSSIVIGPPSRLESAFVSRDDASARPTLNLHVLNSRGDRVVSISDADLINLGEAERAHKLRRIWERARFQAAHGAETIQEILRELA
jgi:hypothetical protein